MWVKDAGPLVVEIVVSRITMSTGLIRIVVACASGSIGVSTTEMGVQLAGGTSVAMSGMTHFGDDCHWT